MGVASMVLSIIALVLAVIMPYLFYITVPMGIVAIVLAAMAKKKAPDGKATAGLVMGIIATALSLLMWLACAACASAAGSLV